MSETERLLLKALENQQKEHEATLKQFEQAINALKGHIEQRVSNAEKTAKLCAEEYAKLQAGMTRLSQECEALRRLLTQSGNG